MKFQKYMIFNIWVCVTDSPWCDGYLEELSPRHLAGDAPPLVHASTHTGAAGAQCFGLNRTVCTFLF